MCGSLRLENEVLNLKVDSRIPQKALQTNAKTDEGYVWSGFARTDGSRDGTKKLSDQWAEKDHKIAVIKGVQFFTERKKITGEQVKILLTGQGIAALVNEKEHKLMILTRAARNNWEKEIHYRMPVTIPSTMSVEEFRGFLNKKLNTHFE